MVIKVYANLAYNHHILDNHDKALQYSIQGITYSHKHTTSYALANLLYRKGIAQFHLNDGRYLDSLKQSISFLEISENYELAKLYRSITKQNYGIDIKVLRDTFFHY